MKESMDIRTIFSLLIGKIAWIISAVVSTALVAFIISNFFITPMYQSTLKLYISNKSPEVVTEISQQDLTIRKSLVNTYIEVLTTKDYMTVMSDYLRDSMNVDITENELIAALTVSSTNDTEIITIKAETDDPELSMQICKAFDANAQDKVRPLIDTGSVTAIEKPREGVYTSPSVVRNSAIGALVGLVLSCGVIILLAFLDNTIKDGEAVCDMLDVQFLGEIPDLTETFKSGYNQYGKGEGYSYGN